MATKQHNVRLSDDLAAAIERAVEERGYESASAFMRHAIQKELREHENAAADVEARIAATLNRQAKELFVSALSACFGLVEQFGRRLRDA